MGDCHHTASKPAALLMTELPKIMAPMIASRAIVPPTITCAADDYAANAMLQMITVPKKAPPAIVSLTIAPALPMTEPLRTVPSMIEVLMITQL